MFKHKNNRNQVFEKSKPWIRLYIFSSRAEHHYVSYNEDKHLKKMITSFMIFVLSSFCKQQHKMYQRLNLVKTL